MKIAVLDWYTVNISGDIPTTQLEELGDVKIISLTKPGETANNIADADIVLCNKVLITKEVMDACPNLKYVGLFATGFNNVDTGYAAKKSILQRFWALQACVMTAPAAASRRTGKVRKPSTPRCRKSLKAAAL